MGDLSPQVDDEELADEKEVGLRFGSRYEILHKLGEGTYGKVYKAERRDNGEFYAIKKIKIHYEEEGFPGTAIREISLLKECDHPNIIKLHEVLQRSSALYLVFEYCGFDLRVYLKTNTEAMREPKWLRSAVKQCFSGVEFCHSHRILHRDLKPQNVLVDEAKRCLKLADFGLARTYKVPLERFSHEVVTLWYRPPEILLGVTKYATPADIWSLGCVSAEMATGQALFPGDSEIDTIFKIFRTLGTPSDEVWPGVESLPDFKPEFPKWRDTHLVDVRALGPALGEDGIELLRVCLRYNPVERLSARRLLQLPFFHSDMAGHGNDVRGSPAVDALALALGDVKL